jgi:hypothetical protein
MCINKTGKNALAYFSATSVTKKKIFLNIVTRLFEIAEAKAKLKTQNLFSQQ